MSERIVLDGDGWEVKGFVGEAWRGAQDPQRSDQREWISATVPGTVYWDLWQAGRIPDPYFECNSLYAEWAADRYWAYRRRFQLNPDYRGSNVQLCLEGIDYSGRVFLNGVELGHHEGMFVPWSCDISSLVAYGEDNLLVIVLDPAPDEESQVGHTSEVRTHKSRMTYWWDFCPRMIHVGVWDSVWLNVTGPVRLNDVHVQTNVVESTTERGQSATVQIEAALVSTEGREVIIHAAVSYGEQLVHECNEIRTVRVGDSTVSLAFSVDNPELWWPNGSGEANLYHLDVRVLVNQEESDKKSLRFGIRKVELIQNSGVTNKALPYTFVVNGIPTYIKGWNWVPLDVMYGLKQPEKLRHLLTLAREANVNLLRVWGGGLIERQAFYDLCDEYGLMVWQEWIQSSSGVENKPSESPEFVQMMVNQAEVIVPRRRNHASLVLWCGGNELQDSDNRPLDDSEPVLGALRRVVERLHPGALWLPTSPTGPLFMNSITNIEQNPAGLHDVHGPWEHQGLTEQYRLYNLGTSMFHSEFGVEGMANLRTIQGTISEPNQWPATRDNLVWNHRGSWWINEPLVQACFGRGIEDVVTLQKASQLLQAEGLRYAVESNRRRAFHNSGTIPWQFNESYPNGYCTASVDYFGRPKPAYYAIRKAYSPVSITAKFDSQIWSGAKDFYCSVFVTNDHLFPIEGHVRAAVIGVSGTVYHVTEYEAITVDGGGVKFVKDLQVSLEGVLESAFFLDLRCTLSDEEVVDNRYVFSRTEDLGCLLGLPTTSLNVGVNASIAGANYLRIENTGDSTAICVGLDDRLPLRTTDYVYFSENGFHLLPGESREVQVWTSSQLTSIEIQVSAWNVESRTVALEGSPRI